VRLIDAVSPQALMNGHIADHKRPSIEPCKAFVAQGALLASTGHAPSRLVDHLERHARLQTWGGVASPTAQEIPGTPTEVCWDKEPKSDQVPTDLVGEELSHAAFEAGRVARF